FSSVHFATPAVLNLPLRDRFLRLYHQGRAGERCFGQRGEVELRGAGAQSEKSKRCRLAPGCHLRRLLQVPVDSDQLLASQNCFPRKKKSEGSAEGIEPAAWLRGRRVGEGCARRRPLHVSANLHVKLRQCLVRRQRRPASRQSLSLAKRFNL